MPFNPELCRNESEVESKLIVQYLLPQLGYTPDTWHQEVVLGSIRLDFLAFAVQVVPFILDANSPMSVVMEAKHPKQNLNNHVLRLRHYLKTLNARHGLLTNGKEIRIYEKIDNDIQLIFQCLGQDVEEKIEEIKKFLSRDSLKNRNLLHNSNFQTFEIDLNIENKRQKTMKIIAVYHNKGGVGKTTTVVNLAAAIRKKGGRVLVIDLDSQANTTFATGLIKFDDEEFDDIKDSNVFNILSSQDRFPVAEIARKSNFCDPAIEVIPAHINLIKQETDLNAVLLSRFILNEKLEQVREKYDIVLIDTPPSLNLYAQIALIATDYLIIPSDLKPFANQGLSNVKDFVKNIDVFRKQLRKPPIEILGVLASKISTNSRFVQSTLKKRMEKIPVKYDIPMMDTVIYERDDLAKCAEKVLIVGDMEIPDPMSIMDFKPDSTSAQEFELLAQEVLRKIGLSL